MLLFPFTTLNWTVETWAYAATKDGGKYLDAAAYYSSLGLVMDLFWLVVVLFSWRVLTREYWRTQIVPADPHIWSWLGQRLPERALLAIYRATFFYGVCRLLAWTGWAHVFARPVIDGVKRRGYPFDLSWTGPWWLDARSLPHVPVVIVIPVTLGPARARLLGGEQALGADGAEPNADARRARAPTRRRAATTSAPSTSTGSRSSERRKVDRAHVAPHRVDRRHEARRGQERGAPGRGARRRPGRPGRGPPRWS